MNQSTLDELQADALGELFNIGVGRAAAALSVIIGGEIELSVPNVEALHIDLVRARIVGSEFHHFSTVSQDFAGPFECEAVLVFPEANALAIVSHMLGNQFSAEESSEYEQEALCEIGNIVLNACMSALSDLFKTEFAGSLPRHRFCDGTSLGFDGNYQADQVLLLQVTMRINRKDVVGHLLFLLGVKSLEPVIACVDDYLIRQGLK